MITMNGETETVWSFNSDGKVDTYSPFMSGAQRMPNGEIVLDFHVGGPHRMFRIYKYAPDFPGIKTLGLS